MPGFDGTGPLGQGPLTGGGRGYCAIAFPRPGSGRFPYGYAGWQGTPVWFGRGSTRWSWPGFGAFPVVGRWWPCCGRRGGRAQFARWW